VLQQRIPHILSIALLIAGLWGWPHLMQSQPLSLPFPSAGLSLADSGHYRWQFEYRPWSHNYVLHMITGDSLKIRTPYFLDASSFRALQAQQTLRRGWWEAQRLSAGNRTGTRESSASLNLNAELLDRVFGTNKLVIQPQGSAELTLGVTTSKVNNPVLPERARKTTSLDFDTRLQMSVTGSIGDKMRMGITYDTDATFDFENEIKLGYEGKEDEIIRKIEVGNVGLTLPGSLIRGSQNLFGLKTELQFGRLSVSALFSQQRGESTVVQLKGGASFNEFQLDGADYDANRHFFLAWYFRDHYESSLATLPILTSDVTITRMEVWVTNRSNNYEHSRNIVAFTDLAESSHIFNPVFQNGAGAEQLPANDTTGTFNRLYPMLHNEVRDINQVTAALSARGLVSGVDYEKLQNARLLSSSEYSFHPRLGYLSLNRPLSNDEVLSVAFEYVYRGRTYQVGDLTGRGVDAPAVLVTKLLRNTQLSPGLPLWDLMMKNVYQVTSSGLSREDFQLNVLYRDDQSANELSYLPEEQTSEDLLLRITGLDRTNTQSDPSPDGRFDWMEGLTVLPDKGQVIFPVLEPLGGTLRTYLSGKGVAPGTVDSYVFDELYDSTLTMALQQSQKNKYLLRGTYRTSTGSEIMLPAANVPQGSVVVTAGNQRLVENIDYTVDYTQGVVRMLNQAILESGQDIRIGVEDNALFDMQTRTLWGAHLNYQISERFHVGATLLNYSERPLTQKVNIGDEPLSNTMWGLDMRYQSDVPWLTRLVDKLPLLQTTAPSSFQFEAEYARLMPGSTPGLQHAGEAYIDDFEGGESSYDMKAFSAWSLSSVPSSLFPEARLTNELAAGMNRARLAWYQIDPLFNNQNYFSSSTPAHIRADANTRSSHYVNAVYETDIFKNRQHKVGESTYIPVLNVAFYPLERGPYNYDTDGSEGYSSGVNPDGSLRQPSRRWGGMMRSIRNSDFEAANIGFIEFWLMDPFAESSGGPVQGGDLYFELGNISEDILKDGRKAYENGLPVDDLARDVDTTSWGVVPTQPSLVNAFDDQLEGGRAAQDVGLDGLSNGDEARFFDDYSRRLSSLIANPSALEQALADPSSDDFRYPRGQQWDERQAGILDRYKYFNGVDGNSSRSEFSNTGLPTVEDIDLDNTLNESESYYQYRVSLRPDDLMEAGRNFITDVVSSTVTFPNGTESTVKWYQFRIPVDAYERTVGPVRDFKSIRFMRMFLTGFEDSVIMRFATLDLVRSEWRMYDGSFLTPGEAPPVPGVQPVSFELATVNIEENAGKDPVPYVLPPGFDRAVDRSSRELQQLNEQSLLLRVKDLPRGDARSIYKNVVLDMRDYKRLRMEVHAERIRGTTLEDNELTLFVRIGSDHRSNYYEYEVPLKLTPWGSADPQEVWPALNRVDIELDQLVAVKLARNAAMEQSESSVSFTRPFAHMIDGRQYFVCGNPNLGNIRTVMIGIRYPGASGTETRSAEVWVNELRLSGQDNEGGWAAQGRMVARLADLATVSLSGSVATVGFGSLDSKLAARSKQETRQYDVSTQAELGKFFPEKAGVQIPVYTSYGETFVTPKYHPLDQDVLFGDAVGSGSTARARDSLRSLGQEYTRRRSFHLTNVRVVPQNSRNGLLSLSNFSFSYSFYETFRRDVRVEKNIEKRYSGSLQYDYTGTPDPVSPFARISWLSAPVFRLLKDFHFNYLPTSLSFGTAMVRNYHEIRTRNLQGAVRAPAPTVDKNFLWTRYFHVAYDLSRSLKIDFSANGIARIDEPDGVVDRHMKDAYQVWRDSVWRNIRDFGRLTQYYHDLVVSYTLPVHKLPYMDWVSSTATYTGSYNWDIAPVMPVLGQHVFEPGNTIKNARQANLTATFMFSRLYDKIPLLSRLRGDAGMEQRYRDVLYKREGLNLRSGVRRIVQHNLRTTDVTVQAYDIQGNAVALRTEVLSDQRVAVTSGEDVRQVTIEVRGRREIGVSAGTLLARGLTRLVTPMRDLSFVYTSTGGLLLPGYLPSASFLGMSGNAPGVPFLLGWQEEQMPARAAARGWLTTDTTFRTPVVFTSGKTVNLRAVLEPLRGLELELTAVRSVSENKSEYYTYDGYSFPERLRNPLSNGNFSMSVVALGTAFDRVRPGDGYRSEAFEAFRNNRTVIAARRADALVAADPAYHPAEGAMEGGQNGYGLNAQQVLLPAFMAAYTGRSAGKISLKTIPGLLQMMPNWQLRFSGLRNLGFVERNFRSLSLNHSYRALYSLGSYSGNPEYSDVREAALMARDRQNNFIPEWNVTSVSITEQFSPLLGLDMTFNNQLSLRVELRKSRMVTLSLANIQITETLHDEYIFGVGYTFAEIPSFLRPLAGNAPAASSRLTMRGDFSLRDSKAFLRRLDQEAQPSQGQRVATLKLSAEYVLNNNFTLSAFYDRMVNDPFVSTAYKTSNATFGFSLRFSMFQF